MAKAINRRLTEINSPQRTAAAIEFDTPDTHPTLVKQVRDLGVIADQLLESARVIRRRVSGMPDSECHLAQQVSDGTLPVEVRNVSLLLETIREVLAETQEHLGE